MANIFNTIISLTLLSSVKS